MIKTRITEMFGVERPIVQGGLMWIARAELTAAVANAGGMGFMTALSFADPEGLRAEIRKCRQMTANPSASTSPFCPPCGRPTIRPTSRCASKRESNSSKPPAATRSLTWPSSRQAGIQVIHKCTSVRHALKAEKIGCDAVSIDGFEAAGHPGEDDVTSPDSGAADPRRL